MKIDFYWGFVVGFSVGMLFVMSMFIASARSGYWIAVDPSHQYEVIQK